MEDFTNVPVFTGEMDVRDLTPVEQGQNALTSVEQARAVAEVQAAIVAARMMPRKEEGAFVRIMNACKRKNLAEQAEYAYKRGGVLITGPTIRLAEVLANNWGNITYGMREISRRSGMSEVEAFAWDLETNTRVTRQFQVKHWRDTKEGGYALKEERDIYELTANQGSRRVRACILQIIPGDIIDAARGACHQTIEKSEEPIEDRIRKMLLAFDGFGVTEAMVEKFLGHKVKAIVAAELVKLTQIYTSLKSGLANREEFFDLTETSAPKTESKPRTRKPKESEKTEGTGPGGTTSGQAPPSLHDDQADPFHAQAAAKKRAAAGEPGPIPSTGTDRVEMSATMTFVHSTHIIELTNGYGLDLADDILKPMGLEIVVADLPDQTYHAIITRIHSVAEQKGKTLPS